ncbi:MAG: phosphotransferase [Flavobacteriales bacterium]
MKVEDIDELARSLEGMVGEKGSITQVETHASWVLLTPKTAYKFKKPVDLGFLNFSTLEKRRFYCQEEVRLNRRLSPDMYRGVVRVSKEGEGFQLEMDDDDDKEADGYGVMMKRLPPKRKMDKLLARHEVRYPDVEAIARMLAPFHRQAAIVQGPPSIDALKKRFNDIQQEEPVFEKVLGSGAEERVERAVMSSDDFLDAHRNLIKGRMEEGMVRDVHGDLHSGNIFIDEEPVIFDCIEFDPAFRQIDILDEIAFFCMDLEAHYEEELASHFLKIYNQANPVMRDRKEEALFSYYKAYRANVRAKVTAIRASQESDPKEEGERLALYLDLMEDYLDRL